MLRSNTTGRNDKLEFKRLMPAQCTKVMLKPKEGRHSKGEIEILNSAQYAKVRVRVRD